MLNIYNTLSQKTEQFKPAEDMEVKMYTCGPSTYQRPHIGNYRTFLFEDILQRYLEYLGYKVIRLITLTNIEDKAIAYAETANLSVEELTNRNEKIFFKDFEQLRIKRPDYTIRASTIVDQAVELIQCLLEKGIAYKFNHCGAENVYFDPTKFPGFGRLVHLDMKKWPKSKRRFHLDTYPGMPWNKGDFILWHGCKPADKLCYETKIGKGRPAWNIQDAAMVTKHLGFSIDIACGGIDNIVRHHDYTLAAAEAVSGKTFAKYWLHGGHLYVEGKKMSKSKGNVLYPENLTEKGYKNEHIRFFLIYHPYRNKNNFTWQKLLETTKKLDEFKIMVLNLEKAKSPESNPRAKTLTTNLATEFNKNMDNNIDVKEAFDKLYENVAELNDLSKKVELSAQDAEKALSDLRKVDQVLQVIF
jgi:cysteinyl-tRNA synthetase